MTNKELLQMAAKANGLTPDTSTWSNFDWDVYGWNPLTDDGDALRLAVKMGIVPRVINQVAFAWKDGVCDMQEPVSGDACMSIRRVIVRAAAEIGKAAQ